MALRRFTACFRRSRGPPVVAHVCDDIACIGAGAEQICAQLKAGGVTYERSPCLGLCDRAPAALVISAGESPSATAVAPANAAMEPNSATTHVGGSEQRLLRRIGRVDPESLDDYRAHGGY